QDLTAATVAAKVVDAILLGETVRAAAMAPEARGPYELSFVAIPLAVKWERASVEEAVGLLDQALRIDPNFPRACAVASLCQSILYQQGWTKNPAETKRRGMELGRRALNTAETDLIVLRNFMGAEIGWGEDLTAVTAIVERTLARLPEERVLG